MWVMHVDSQTGTLLTDSQTCVAVYINSQTYVVIHADSQTGVAVHINSQTDRCRYTNRWSDMCSCIYFGGRLFYCFHFVVNVNDVSRENAFRH